MPPRSLLALASLALLVGCGPRARASAALAESNAPLRLAAQHLAAAPPPSSDGRLPRTVIPRAYTLALQIDPASPRFSGVVTILVEVPAPTTAVVLHARDMNITGVAVRVPAPGGDRAVDSVRAVRVAHDGAQPEELVLGFASALPPGTAKIEIRYDAPFALDLAGLYRVTEQERRYVFSQFESTDARRAFPCFDEPVFKTPYDVSITAPRGLRAFSNQPEISQTVGPGETVVHAYRTSPPLPSYLVAFAVGDFDVVEGQKEPVPIRVVTTKGRAALAGEALEVAAALLGKLVDYFGMRYPYDKLDLVAVPDFAAGAMENPGLVTFRDVLLLLDPEHTTTSARRAQAEVIAHEFAHQWVGDLVTMSWWDDLWLNEGFATWAEAKMVDAWRPNFGATLEQLLGAEHVMDLDALSSARAVRQPVHSTSEAMEAFDGITYEKGAAVLRMIEGWLGEDTFQRGIRRYLHENAWKNTHAVDLFNALDFVSTQRVGELANPFLDQPGVPLVTGHLRCGADAELELRQSEWRPLGGTAPDPNRPGRRWTLPVCVDTDGQKAASCFTLGGDPITRSLGARCPSWVSLNAGLSGYYRYALDQKQLLGFARTSKGRGARDRLGVLSSAWAGVRDGSLEPGALLEALPAYDADPNRFVVEEVVSVLIGMDRALVEDGARAAFERVVTARLGPRKRALGWAPAATATSRSGSPDHERGRDEDDDARLERRTILWAMGDIAHDPKTLEEAAPYAARWLADPMDVSEEIASVAVPLASIRAGESRLAELRSAAKSARVPQDRLIAVRAMGMFENPNVLRAALDLTLTGELKLSELRTVVGTAASRRPSRALVFAWEKEHWAALRQRLPGALLGTLAGIASSACTEGEREQSRDFFVPAMHGVEGAKRGLDEALDFASTCTALRGRFAATLTSWLAAHSSEGPAPNAGR